MTTAFVAGATGFTGREVARALAAGGVKTFAHVRPDSARLDEWRARFAAVGAETDATPWDEAAMTATFERLAPDVIFGLLGTTRSRARADAARSGRPVDYETVDYGLTAVLIRAAITAISRRPFGEGTGCGLDPLPGPDGSTLIPSATAGLKPRFVYLSAVGTPDGDRPPTTAYGLARWKCERAIKASGLPYVIARPSFIAGPGRDERRPTESIGVAAVNGALALAGALGARRLKERYRSTTSEALAAALVRLALDPAARNLVVESEDLRGA